MGLQLVEKVRALLHPHEHVAMKAHEFEYGCDDLGQYEGDVERQVPAVVKVPLTDDAARLIH